MPVMFPLHAGLATHESLFVPAWYGVAPQDRAIVRQEAIAGANDYARARRRGRFELRSMDWMISSSAAASAVDERCNFASSNPPSRAVRMEVLRVFGSSDGGLLLAKLHRSSTALAAALDEI